MVQTNVFIKRSILQLTRMLALASFIRSTPAQEVSMADLFI